MPAAEIQVTIGSIVFNDYSSGTPVYVLRNTAQLLEPPEPRQTKTVRQAAHGVDDSLSFYNERLLAFEGEILGSSQGDRKTKENALRKALALAALQSYGGNDGYILVKFTDEDGTLMQCYAKIASKITFDILDNTNPARRGFGFVLMAKDPNLYSQTLQQQTNAETVAGTNFTIVETSSPTIPFTLYNVTADTLVCTNGGTGDSPPVLTVHGPTANPKVKNVTTGVFMNLTKAGGLSLLSGETCVIDVNGRTITKVVSGVSSNASGYLSDDSDWIVFAPGANELTLIDDSADAIAATLSAAWRDVYL